jgi:hypothetical protein
VWRKYSPALAVTDFDIIVFSPVSPSKLIDADTNDPPFEAISNIFGTPGIANYASPSSDGELSDAAISADCPNCLPAGTMFFSRRATRDLWKLTPAGTGYQQVGSHSLSNLLAVGGLAFAPGLGVPDVPALSPRMLVLLADLLGMVGWVLLRRVRA